MSYIVYVRPATRQSGPEYVRISPSGRIIIEARIVRRTGESWERALIGLETSSMELRIKLLRNDDDEGRAMPLVKCGSPSVARALNCRGLVEQFKLRLSESTRFPAVYDESQRMIRVDLRAPISGAKGRKQ